LDFLSFFAAMAGSLLVAGSVVALATWRAASRPAPVAAAPPQLPALIGAEELARLRGELAGAMADLNAVRAEWKAHQKQLDGYLEAFEDLEEVVERKRRRFAARESKEKVAVAEPEVDPFSRDAARLRARARGFRV